MRAFVALVSLTASVGCDVVFDVQPTEDRRDARADGPMGDAQRDPYRAAVLADAPAAYFRLGDATPVDAADEVGPAACSYFGKVSPGREGAVASGNTAVVFGDADRRVGAVNCGDRFDFAGQAAFSLELWFKGESTGDYKTLVGKYRDPTVAAGYKLHLLNKTLTFARGNNGSDQTLAPFDLPMLGLWTHVVATYDGAFMVLYIDGALQRTIPSVVSVPDSSTDFQIGAENGATNPTTPFFGSIDEVAVYERALTGAQARAHFIAATEAR